MQIYALKTNIQVYNIKKKINKQKNLPKVRGSLKNGLFKFKL